MTSLLAKFRRHDRRHRRRIVDSFLPKIQRDLLFDLIDDIAISVGECHVDTRFVRVAVAVGALHPERVFGVQSVFAAWSEGCFVG